MKICDEFDCPLRPCKAYNEAGIILRTRLKYCPLGDVPKTVEIKFGKIRTGQQKQKKR